jgi:broad specificity phosphatase PhoE
LFEHDLLRKPVSAFPDRANRSIAVTARLILIAHASTAALRGAYFPADEPLDELGRTSAAAVAGCLTNADRWLTSPELRTRQTAVALGLSADVEPALRDCDYGSWSGKSFKDVCAREPEAVAAWLRAPEVAPHGGESVLSLMQRVGGWLAGEQARPQRSIVVTHSAVIRAAIVQAIGAPPQSFWRIDIAPLSITRLSGDDSRWNLSSSSCTAPAAG